MILDTRFVDILYFTQPFWSFMDANNSSEQMLLVACTPTRKKHVSILLVTKSLDDAAIQFDSKQQCLNHFLAKIVHSRLLAGATGLLHAQAQCGGDVTKLLMFTTHVYENCR